MKNKKNMYLVTTNLFKTRKPYKHFNEIERKNLFQYCKLLSEYLLSENIEQIIFIDRSARGAWVGIDTYWKTHFESASKPRMYFLNPHGVNKSDSLVEFKTKFSFLYSQNQKPVVVFDTCCHSGWTLRTVKNFLERLDFQDLRFITAESPDSKSHFETATCLDKGLGSQHCYPFGDRWENIVGTTDCSICSKPRSQDRQEATEVRQEIRRIIFRKGK